MTNRYLSIEEVATHFHVTTRTIFRWRAANLLPSPCSGPGQPVKWSEADIVAFESRGGPNMVCEMQADDHEAEQHEHRKILAELADESPPEAIRREIRSQLRLPMDASDGSVLAAILNLTADLAQARRALAELKHQKLLDRDNIRRAVAILDRLVQPDDLERANAEIRKVREQVT
ncbi:MAG: helix-turn-helix domain-containing protein [Phycisphaerae bacterium]|nr:helix-turn-helix domain-containing protein [Phycisphaerae bacterium]